MAALSVYRASNVWNRVQRRRLVFEEQSASFSNCDQQLCTKLDYHCLWRDPRSRVLNSIQFICISISLVMPNKLLYTWCGDYCKCVRPAQLPVLTEVWAPSLLEQHPWYVPHWDRPGYNSCDHLCESDPAWTTSPLLRRVDKAQYGTDTPWLRQYLRSGRYGASQILRK